MNVAILGSGCKNCNLLEQRTREALAALDVQATIEHVSDFSAIAAYGVMRTPGLVVNGTVVMSGRVPTTAQVAELIRPYV